MNFSTTTRKGLTLAACLALAGLGSGCELRKRMYDQEKFESYEKTSFFGDGMSARPLVAGTVARGRLYADEHLYAGVVDGAQATTFPFEITLEVLQRGQTRYTIYCSPCHDMAGTGNGMVVQRGFKAPPSFHIDRLREASPGYYFGAITQGFGVMPGYAYELKHEDRWAVAAYIRALQLSQNARLDDVPETAKANLMAPANE